MTNLELERRSLPNEPGIYMFLDEEDNVIYVGKASNLRKRVSQYFLKTKYIDPYYEEKIREMVKNIHSIKFIVTENEKEAYILENIQIKKLQPKFNVIMRDSKSYPWVAIFYGEKFPRIKLIRNPEKFPKSCLFLGPYTDKKEITRILRDLRKIFPYCSCKNPVKKKSRPCIYYQIKLCLGPCIGAVSQETYIENVKKVELFLRGETHQLKKQIEEKMLEASEKHEYEVAAFWRDKLNAIDKATTSQNVLSSNIDNKDIIDYYLDDSQKYMAMVIIHVREGKITHKSSFEFDLSKKVIEKSEVLASLVEQFYQNTKNNLPDVIVLPTMSERLKSFEKILREYKNTLTMREPQKDEMGLLRIAKKNAVVMVNQAIKMEEIKKKQEQQAAIALEEIKKILQLDSIPSIIEGFDVSNIEGKDATGSMVCFIEGKPSKENYRYFKIRSKSTPDDVSMMKEIIKRRYTRLLKESGTLPDLILVDGGKGQLNAGLSILKELQLDNIPIIGLAKKFEEIYVPGKSRPIILPDNSPLLRLFEQVRDEAHRFALKLHKKQREKKYKMSILDQIPGIGPKTRNKLLLHFGSIQNIKKSSLEELKNVIGEKLAKIIKNNLSEEE